MKLTPDRYEQLKVNYKIVRNFVEDNNGVYEQNKRDLDNLPLRDAKHYAELLLRSIMQYEEMVRMLKIMDDMGIDKVVDK
jgi:hypothetical protein